MWRHGREWGVGGGQQVRGFIEKGGLRIGVEAKAKKMFLYRRALNAVLDFGLLS